MPAPLSEHEVERQKRRREVTTRRRRIRFLALFALVALLASAYAVMSLTSRSTAQVSDEELLVSDRADIDAPVDTSGPEHPFFARLGGQGLSLPVNAGDVTIIAYHPLSDERAVPLEPMGRRINSGFLSKLLTKTVGRIFSGNAAVRYYVLKGNSHAVAETASVDIGAPAGSPLTSPVSGEVIGVKTYSLCGKYQDVQIDIRPDGVSGVSLTVLLVNSPAVTIGQTVVAGKTRLGTVREAVGDLGKPLVPYTHDSGSHVNIQVTRDVLS